jgi:PAS domain S-box-containing protein
VWAGISLPFVVWFSGAAGLALAAAFLARFLNGVRKHKALLDELFEQSTQAVALATRGHRIIRVNRKFTEVFGYTQTAAVGRSIGDLIVPAESQEEYRRHMGSLARGERVETEGIRCRQDGSRFPASIALVPCSLPGQPAAVYGIYRDITKHRREEEARSASEARWRVIFENSAVGVTVTDIHGNFIAANRAYQEMVGYSEQELRTLNYLDLTFEEDRPQSAALAAENWAGRLPRFQLEKRYRRKDGRTIWVRITVSKSGAGDTPQIGMAIVEDITERKRTEGRLLDYEKIVEHLQEMVAVVDRDYRLVIANQAFLDNRGMRLEQVVGHLVSELLEQETFDRVVKVKLDECLQGRVVEFEIAATYPKLGRRDMLVTYYPIEGSAGIDRIASVAEDITERKRAERELQLSFAELQALNAQLQRVREEERTSLARELHDQLGQSLTAIRIDLAGLKSTPDRDQQSQRIDAISALVDETIRTVRRISTQLRPGILDDLGLVAALEWAAEEFQSRTGIPCEVTLPETNPAIDAERATALFRIFQETLTNIARHAGATEVTVVLSQQSGHIVLEVRDNGRGIGENRLSGSGSLGILGMRERALLLGGEFLIGNPGGGTTVRVRIPIGLAKAAGR